MDVRSSKAVLVASSMSASMLKMITFNRSSLLTQPSMLEHRDVITPIGFDPLGV